MSQRKHRDKKRSKEFNLNLDIQDLKQQIHDLNFKKQFLETSEEIRQAALVEQCTSVVDKWFELFSHGRVPKYQDQMEEESELTNRQNQFLKSETTSEFELWSLHSPYDQVTSSIMMDDSDRLRIPSEFRIEKQALFPFQFEELGIIKANAVINFRLDPSVWANLFPVIENRQQVLQELTDYSLVVHATFHFYFSKAKLDHIDLDYSLIQLSNFLEMLELKNCCKDQIYEITINLMETLMGSNYTYSSSEEKEEESEESTSSSHLTSSENTEDSSTEQLQRKLSLDYVLS